MRWTKEQIERLCAEYANASTNDKLNLDYLATLFDKHKTNVSRKARELGLTKQTRPKSSQLKLSAKENVYATKEERASATGVRIKQHIAEHGHPRGALGMKHTPEAKVKMRDATVRAWANPESVFNSAEFRQAASDAMLQNITAGKMNTGHSRARGGRRADLGGRYFRSAWEANYARFLNLLVMKGEIAGWEFECKTFVFEAIKRGTRAYTPDFKVIANDGSHVWHEVKGWMDQPSRTRLARMAKYFPEETVIVIDAAWFKSANKTMPGIVQHWESGTTR